MIYLNVKSLKIGATSSKKLGTYKDYYSLDTELVLSKEIEQPMSLIADKILALCKEDCIEGITLTEKETVALKKYILSLLTRSEVFEEELVNHSVFAQFLPKQDIRRFSVGYSLQPEQLKETPFYHFYPGIIIYQGNRSFVVPRNGFYYAERDKNEAFVMAPISPKCAACLFPHQSRFDVVLDDNSMDYFNLLAYSCEKSNNNTFVATDKKEELERLKRLVQSFIGQDTAVSNDTGGKSGALPV